MPSFSVEEVARQVIIHLEICPMLVRHNMPAVYKQTEEVES